LKEVFVNYVRTGHILETDFLGNRNNCLELAQRIVNAVIEFHPEVGLMHVAVSRAAAELQTRTDKEAKNLRAILDSVKPKLAMTAEDALKAFGEICQSGNLIVCLAVLPDEMEQFTEAGQMETYQALANTSAKVDEKFGQIADEYVRKNSAISIVRETPKPETTEATPASEGAPVETVEANAELAVA